MGADAARRETWVDVAKGICILLVVVHHAVQIMDVSGWGWEPLTQASASLKSLRMPLFFFASGLFAASAMVKSWADVLKSKVALFLYLYLLWSCIRSLFFSVVPWSLGDTEPIAQIWRVLILPNSGLWYLYALSLYFLAARMLTALSPRSQILIAVLVSAPAASGLIASEHWALNSMLANFMYFIIALHGRAAALKMARVPSLPVLVTSVGTWGTLTTIAYLANLGSYSLLRVPLSLLAVLGGIHMCAMLDAGPLSRTLRYLGQRTLRIYLLHVMVLGVVFAVLPTPLANSPVQSVAILTFALTLSLVGSLAGGHALGKIRWLWRLSYPRDLEVGPRVDRSV